MRHTGYSDPSTNVLDLLDARLVALDAHEALVPIVPFRPTRVDARLELRDAGWRASPAGHRALAALGTTEDPLGVCFADAELERLGTVLERGGPDPLATRAVARGRRWVVNFGDPNTTKALHVGHLRNIAIGNAVASAAAALGAEVVRQSRVGDFGRSMGEAMAGYLEHGDGRTPARHGVKGDRLIGECYLRYVLGLPARAAATADPARDGDAALARERVVHRDMAEDLLERWRAGDPAVTRLYADVRAWVREGHDATYARLGVRVDRTLCESDYLDHGEALAQEALTRGAIERGEGHATMYATGEEAYPQLLLHRRDGFPTQHLRYVATYDATRPLLAGARSVAVFGSEWRGLIRYCEALLQRLRPGEEIHPTDNLMHGMVVGDAGDAVKSSKGGALLVDELFERVEDAAPVAGLARRHSRLDAEQLTRIVLLGFFLGRPLQERVSVSLDELLDARRNVGWAFAQAWARVCDPRHDGDPDPCPDDVGYRFVLVQSQRHRRLLARCVEELDLLPFVRFHYHLARWFAGVQATPRIARAMRGVLGEGLAALGLATPGTAVGEGAGDRAATGAAAVGGAV
jgi:arginyl-tRNA synthetase